MYEIESKFEIYLFLIIAAAGRMRRSIIQSRAPRRRMPLRKEFRRQFQRYHLKNWGLLLPNLGSKSAPSTYPCLYAVPLLPGPDHWQVPY